MTTWHTPATARALPELWPDVEQLEDTTLQVLLDVAREQVIAYAPALPLAEEIVLPEPVVEVPDAPLAGTLTASRLAGSIVRWDLSLTNDGADKTGGLYAGISVPSEFRPATNLLIETGPTRALRMRVDGGLELSWGTHATDETITLSAFAPALVPDDEPVETIPSNYVYGQLMQAKNTWNAARVDASGGVGDGSEFVIRPTPLDWHVKQILRPRRGVPRVR